MRYPGFIGGTYTGQAPTPACDRAINLYPEIMQGAGAPENNIILLGTPGLALFGTLPASPANAIWSEPSAGRAFAIAAGTLYEVFEDGSSANRGAIGAGPYSFASNGLQVMISAHGAGYVLTLGTNTLAQITAPDFMGSAQCAFIDGYFLSLVPNSRKFQISDLYAGSSWNGLDFASAEGSPDNILEFIVSHRELWLFGSRRGEVYVNTGNPAFPFERLSGVYIEQGAIPGTLARLDNTVFWVGQDGRGNGVVWRANGYTPQRVSTHAVEYFLCEYSKHGEIGDATAYAYQDQGHTFYVVHFPSASRVSSPAGGTTADVVNGATWVYDAATGLWHERAHWDALHGRYEAHLGRTHTFAFDKHLVGDWKSGKIYELSADYFDDAGDVIRRIRRAPHIDDELRLLFYDEFGVSLQVGAGNATEPDPQCWMRSSDDGGITWSNERLRSMGKQGEYRARVRWLRNGRSRRRAFEWGTTAKVPVCLVDAFLQVSRGTN